MVAPLNRWRLAFLVPAVATIGLLITAGWYAVFLPSLYAQVVDWWAGSDAELPSLTRWAMYGLVPLIGCLILLTTAVVVRMWRAPSPMVHLWFWTTVGCIGVLGVVSDHALCLPHRKMEFAIFGPYPEITHHLTALRQPWRACYGPFSLMTASSQAM